MLITGEEKADDADRVYTVLGPGGEPCLRLTMQASLTVRYRTRGLDRVWNQRVQFSFNHIPSSMSGCTRCELLFGGRGVEHFKCGYNLYF